jgi:O-antigen/teichoic acid export membrane protein
LIVPYSIAGQGQKAQPDTLFVLHRMSALIGAGWNRSVIRRASTLLAITLPGLVFNLGLTYAASHMLNSEEFGIFYTAITTINILFAPAIVVNLFFSRFVSTIFANDGLGAAQESFQVVLRTVGRWLTVASVVALAAVLILGGLGGQFSTAMGIVVIVVVATSYFAECGRVILQGEQRFLRLGLYTLSWMLMRFVLGLIGLWVFGTVWGGLAGVAISAPLAFVAFFGTSPLSDAKNQVAAVKPPRLVEIAPFALGYGIFSAAAHADIVVAYAVFDPVQLGVYSASSVLPKGLLMATLPIIQLAFPLMVGSNVAARLGLDVILKGIGLTIAVTMVGAAAIFALSGPACSSSYGLVGCDAQTMAVAALAMIPFGALRFLVSVDYSARRDWMPSLVILPAVAFIVFGLSAPLTPYGLAVDFAIFSVLTLLPYGLLRFLKLRPPRTP